MSPGERSETRRPARLGILDDHEVLLDSLRSWISVYAPDFHLQLVASSWQQFVNSEHFPPDLVLLDVQLREQISIEARVRTCRAAGAHVIVLSGVDSTDTRERALTAGAAMFLHKSVPMMQVMDAARRVMGMPVDVDRSAPQAPPEAPPGMPERPRLSASEQAALTLYAEGNSTQQVAEELGVGFETAKTFLRRVRQKYDRVGRPASTKSELIRRAAEDGLLR